jgi:predicted nucleic acid-binding protein
MSFVLDSSAALAMLLPDEHSADADGIGERLLRTVALVPSIWPLEVRNALLVALRGKRITSREFDERVSLLEELPLEIDPGCSAEVLSRVVDIARRQSLSTYDASYVELARRHDIPLATFDARLRKACHVVGVVALP